MDAVELDCKTQRRAVAAKDIIAGTFGGVAQVLTAQPFDTIKVRMVCLPEKFNKGTWDCLKRTVGKEGLGALYKGTLSPIAGVGACVSIQFTVLEASKRALVRRREARGEGSVLSIAEQAMCGFMAGSANAVVSSPVEHIRIQMQTITDASATQYKGTWDCAKQVFRDYGLKGIFRGYPTTLLRESFGYAGYFGAYEVGKRGVMKLQGETDHKNASSLAVLAGGGAAGFGMWLPMYPVDAIKSKIHGDSLVNRKYISFQQTARLILKEEGVAGFYRGFVPCMLRAFPVNAVTFLAFEICMKAMDSVYY